MHKAGCFFFALTDVTYYCFLPNLVPVLSFSSDAMGNFFLLDFDTADVAKRLKEELSERNRENEMLKSWNGDPCSLSTWEGFSCEPKDGARVVVKL